MVADRELMMSLGKFKFPEVDLAVLTAALPAPTIMHVIQWEPFIVRTVRH